MNIAAHTSGLTLTAQQPVNNVVRVTVQALAGILGGTQSLHTNSFDEALALPTEKAARIALRTQQILAHESGVANVIDPLGGSYLVEALTNQMEEDANRYFREIDRIGCLGCAGELGISVRGAPAETSITEATPPIMMNSPWAKLITPIIPKMIDRPSAIST